MDRVQRGIFEAFLPLEIDAASPDAEQVVDKVCWAYQQNEYLNASSLITLELTGGPATGHREGPHPDALIKPPDTVTVRVETVTSGQRAWLELNSFRHFYDMTGVDTPTTVRDAFIASIMDHESEWVTASALNATDIGLAATSFPRLWGLDHSSHLLVGDGVFSGNAARVTTGIEDMQLTINAYSQQLELRNGARFLAGKARRLLRTRRAIDTLERYNMAVGFRGAVIPLNAIVGGNWQTQAAATVDLRTETFIIEPEDTIETANLSLTFYDGHPGNTPINETLQVATP